MADNNQSAPISPSEYKKVTEELYSRNLELKNLYKQVDGLNKDLEAANKNLKHVITQRESLVHLITHKVKGSFTRTKYIFAEMLSGSFGSINDQIKKMAEKGLESDAAGIQTIDLVLNASNLESGIVKYEIKKIDFKDVVQKTLNEKSGPASVKGLKLTLDLPDEKFLILGDEFWLQEVVSNLIDNSIKYTEKGDINVSLSKKNDKVLFSVKDTGIGLNEEDKKKLFTQGGRGKEALKINVDSTGYGLYSVKLIIDAHGGRVWAESKGAGRGSTFFIEIDSV